MHYPYLLVALAIALALGFASRAAAEPAVSQPVTYWIGADISMLSEIEGASGRYVETAGGPAQDLVPLLRRRGVNLFRLRVFVNPSNDYASTWGATQNLDQVGALAKRVVAADGAILLDLHYSDTWADPAHQFKPAAWNDLPFDVLEQRVHDYTADVLERLRADGATPAMVQVGNEIGVGMLWPDGKIGGVPAHQEAAQWSRLARLINAGCRAVREASARAGTPIRIVLHTHGGGSGVPVWFFEHLAEQRPVVDYDIIGVSVYPSFGNELDRLGPELAKLATTHAKDVLVAEVAYPHKPADVAERDRAALTFPTTPAGQIEFLRALDATVKVVPNGRGIGWCWWYPEAIRMKGREVYKDGAEAWFDEDGVALPVLERLEQ